MASNLSFTNRSNANRAAKRILGNGTAPAPQYTIRQRGDGHFEIVWLTGSPGLAMAAWPAPTTEELAKELAAAGIVSDATGPEPTPEPAPAKPARQRKARTAKASTPAAPKGPRAKFAGAPVEPGKLPEKPVLTAAGFTASYQKRIDRLAELAEAGDWDAVAAFEVNGKNTYSKIVTRYRDQLVASNRLN